MLFWNKYEIHFVFNTQCTQVGALVLEQIFEHATKFQMQTDALTLFPFSGQFSI